MRKSEVEKRLRDAQQHIIQLTATNTASTHNLSNGSENRSTQDETIENHSRVNSLCDHQNETKTRGCVF